MQRGAIERAARARGEEIGQWFSEKRSGGALERAELDQLRTLVKQGKIQKLYIYRLDRLTRRGIRDTLSVLQELKEHGCQVVSIADSFPLDGEAAELVIAVLAWAAQFERKKIRENLAEARARLEKAGRKWGRPPRVSPALAMRIQLARQAGDTIRELAARFKVPRSTIGLVLSGKGAYAPADPKPEKKPLKKR